VALSSKQIERERSDRQKKATPLLTREKIMRMMLKFTLPVEKGNQAINDGSLGKTMETILAKLKPEAAYFAPINGQRCGMLFFDMSDPSQIVETVEPFFLKLNAAVEMVPVMNGDDLRKGLAKVTHK
jgi:hypothetical protein